eukprot:1399676-Pleurochrysis_carterae.AAC.1
MHGFRTQKRLPDPTRCCTSTRGRSLSRHDSTRAHARIRACYGEFGHGVDARRMRTRAAHLLRHAGRCRRTG